MNNYLDHDFKPIILEIEKFNKEVKDSGKLNLLSIILIKDNFVFRKDIEVFTDGYNDEYNIYIIERYIKSMLYIYGGYKLLISGSNYIYKKIKEFYSKGGKRSFDYYFMSRIYNHEFEVIEINKENIPMSYELTTKIEENLSGYRIGIDVGGSDIKVSILRFGEVISSKEIIWNPKEESDPSYHLNFIYKVLSDAYNELSNIDFIGISTAGVVVNNKLMISSIFRKVHEKYNETENLYINVIKMLEKDIEKEIPFKIINDGDASALAGVFQNNLSSCLGIAMGTSEAGGYIDNNRCLHEYLSELSFVPIDLSEKAIEDSYPKDKGIGSKYFSQDAVIRLSEKLGVNYEGIESKREKLKHFQELFINNKEKYKIVYQTIGEYLGYSLIYYFEFYNVKNVFLFGRVLSFGGDIIVNTAKNIIDSKFPKYKDIRIILPDENERRVGQSLAVALL